MQLPDALKADIEQFFQNVSPIALQRARESLTHHYKKGGVSPFSNEAALLAYLGARMPATFAAVFKVLQNVTIQGHLLDLGAGLAAASWAAVTRYSSIEHITLIEQNREAIALGKRLFPFERGEWIEQSLTGHIPKADCGILSYVIGELMDPESIVMNCWQAVNTLIIIEPGTPKAFHLMKKIRGLLLAQNGHLIAPCPHSYICPNEWCHFSVRVERSRIHRLLKEGTLGYEDEKFCYLVVSKQPIDRAPNRIIRHPITLQGHIKLSLCTDQGTLVEKIVSKKDKELYRKARKAEWGDQM